MAKILPHEVLAGQGKLAHEVEGKPVMYGGANPAAPPPPPDEAARMRQQQANQQAAQQKAAKEQEAAEAEQRRIQQEEAERVEAEAAAAEEAALLAAEEEQRRVAEEEVMRRLRESEEERIREEERNETAADRYWRVKERQLSYREKREAKEKERQERLKWALYGNPNSPLYGQDPAYTDDESMPNRWSRQRRMEIIQQREQDALLRGALRQDDAILRQQLSAERDAALQNLRSLEEDAIRRGDRNAVADAQARAAELKEQYDAIWRDPQTRRQYLAQWYAEREQDRLYLTRNPEALPSDGKFRYPRRTGEDIYFDSNKGTNEPWMGAENDIAVIRNAIAIHASAGAQPNAGKNSALDGYGNVLKVLESGGQEGDIQYAIEYLEGITQAGGHEDEALRLYRRGMSYSEDAPPGWDSPTRSIEWNQEIADEYRKIANKIRGLKDIKEGRAGSPSPEDLEQLAATEEMASARAIVASNEARAKYQAVGITPDRSGSMQHAPEVTAIAEKMFNAMPEEMRTQGYTVVDGVLDEIYEAAGGGQAGVQAVKEAQSQGIGQEQVWLGNTTAQTGGVYHDPNTIRVEIIKEVNDTYANTTPDQRRASQVYNEKYIEGLERRQSEDFGQRRMFAEFPPETYANIETMRYIFQNPEEFSTNFVRNLESQADKSEIANTKALGREPARVDASIRAAVFNALPEAMRGDFTNAARGKRGDELLDVAGQFTQVTEGMIADYGLTTDQINRLRILNDDIADRTTSPIPDLTFLEQLADFIGDIKPLSPIGVDVSVADVAVPVGEAALEHPYTQGVIAVAKETRIPDLQFGEGKYGISWDGSFRKPTAQEWGYAAAATALGVSAALTGGTSLGWGTAGFFAMGVPGALAVGSGVEMAATGFGAPQGNIYWGPTNMLDRPRQIMYSGLREAGFSKEEATALSILGDIIFWTAPGFAMLPRLLANYRANRTLLAALGRDALGQATELKHSANPAQKNILQKLFGEDDLVKVAKDPEKLENLKQQLADPKLGQALSDMMVQEQFMAPSRVPAQRPRGRRVTVEGDPTEGTDVIRRREMATFGRDYMPTTQRSVARGFMQGIGPANTSTRVHRYFQVLLAQLQQPARYTDDMLRKAGFSNREEAARSLGNFAWTGVKDPRLERLMGKWIPEFTVEWTDGIPKYFPQPGSHFDQFGPHTFYKVESGENTVDAGDLAEIVPLTDQEVNQLNTQITEHVSNAMAGRDLQLAVNALGFQKVDDVAKIYLNYLATGKPHVVSRWPGWFRDELDKYLQRQVFVTDVGQVPPGQYPKRAQMSLTNPSSLWIDTLDEKVDDVGKLSFKSQEQSHDPPLPSTVQQLGEFEDLITGKVNKMFVPVENYAERYIDSIIDRVQLHWSHPEALTLDDYVQAGFTTADQREVVTALENFKQTGDLDPRLEKLFPGQLKFNEEADVFLLDQAMGEYAVRYLNDLYEKFQQGKIQFTDEQILRAGFADREEVLEELGKFRRQFTGRGIAEQRRFRGMGSRLHNDPLSAAHKAKHVLDYAELEDRLALLFTEELRPGPRDLPDFAKHGKSVPETAEDLLTSQKLFDMYVRHSSEAIDFKNRARREMYAALQDYWRNRILQLNSKEQAAIAVHQVGMYQGGSSRSDVYDALRRGITFEEPGSPGEQELLVKEFENWAENNPEVAHEASVGIYENIPDKFKPYFEVNSEFSQTSMAPIKPGTPDYADMVKAGELVSTGNENIMLVTIQMLSEGKGLPKLVANAITGNFLNKKGLFDKDLAGKTLNAAAKFFAQGHTAQELYGSDLLGVSDGYKIAQVISAWNDTAHLDSLKGGIKAPEVVGSKDVEMAQAVLKADEHINWEAVADAAAVLDDDLENPNYIKALKETLAELNGDFDSGIPEPINAKVTEIWDQEADAIADIDNALKKNIKTKVGEYSPEENTSFPEDFLDYDAVDNKVKQLLDAWVDLATTKSPEYNYKEAINTTLLSLKNEIPVNLPKKIDSKLQKLWGGDKDQAIADLQKTLDTTPDEIANNSFAFFNSVDGKTQELLNEWVDLADSEVIPLTLNSKGKWVDVPLGAADEPMDMATIGGMPIPEFLKTMDNLLENSEAPTNMILYRAQGPTPRYPYAGYRPSNRTKLRTSWNIGDTWREDAYASTSLDVNTSTQFLQGTYDFPARRREWLKHNVIFRIHVPKGTKSLGFPSASELDPTKLAKLSGDTHVGSGYDHPWKKTFGTGDADQVLTEFEVILPRKTTFRVIDNTKKLKDILPDAFEDYRDLRVIDVEIVGTEHLMGKSTLDEGADLAFDDLPASIQKMAKDIDPSQRQMSDLETDVFAFISPDNVDEEIQADRFYRVLNAAFEANDPIAKDVHARVKYLTDEGFKYSDLVGSRELEDEYEVLKELERNMFKRYENKVLDDLDSVSTQGIYRKGDPEDDVLWNMEEAPTPPFNFNDLEGRILNRIYKAKQENGLQGLLNDLWEQEVGTSKWGELENGYPPELDELIGSLYPQPEDQRVLKGELKLIRDVLDEYEGTITDDVVEYIIKEKLGENSNLQNILDTYNSILDRAIIRKNLPRPTRAEVSKLPDIPEADIVENITTRQEFGQDWDDLRTFIDDATARRAGFRGRHEANDVLERELSGAGGPPGREDEYDMRIQDLKKMLESKQIYQKLDDLRAQGIDPLEWVPDDPDKFTKLQLYAQMERQTGRRDWMMSGGAGNLRSKPPSSLDKLRADAEDMAAQYRKLTIEERQALSPQQRKEGWRRYVAARNNASVFAKADAEDAAIYAELDALREAGIDPEKLDVDELTRRYQALRKIDEAQEGKPIPADQFTPEDVDLMTKVQIYAELERRFGHRNWQIRGAQDVEAMQAKLAKPERSTIPGARGGKSEASKWISAQMKKGQAQAPGWTVDEVGKMRDGTAIYGIRPEEEKRLFELMGMSADVTAVLQTGKTPGKELAEGFASGLQRARAQGGGPAKPWEPLMREYARAAAEGVGVSGRIDRFLRKNLGPLALAVMKPSAFLNPWERGLMSTYHMMESMFHVESRLMGNEIASQLANNFEFAPNTIKKLSRQGAGDFAWVKVELKPGEVLPTTRVGKTVGNDTYFSTIYVLQNPSKFNLNPTNNPAFNPDLAIKTIDDINDQILRMDRKWNLNYGKFHTQDKDGIYVPQKWFFEQTETREGSNWFTQHRVIPDFGIGLTQKNAKGELYEPISWNPLDMYALRMHSGARARAKAGLDKVIDQLDSSGIQFIDQATNKRITGSKMKDVKETMNDILNPQFRVRGRDLQQDMKAITAFARTTVLGGDLSPLIGIQGMRFFSERGPLHFFGKAAEAGSYLLSHEGWKAYLEKEFPTMLEMVRLGKGNVFNTAMEFDASDLMGAHGALGKGFESWKRWNNTLMTRATVVYKIELYKNYKDFFKAANTNDDIFNVLDYIPGLERGIRDEIGKRILAWRKRRGLGAKARLTQPMTNPDYSKWNPLEGPQTLVEDISLEFAPLTDERISELAMRNLENVMGGGRVWMDPFRAFSEGMALFTPGWFRSNMGLTANVVNPGIEGLLPRRYMIKWFMTHAMMAEIMSRIFTGGEEGTNWLHPEEGDWLAIKGPGGMIVHTSGTTRSLMRPFVTQKNFENILKSRVSPSASAISQTLAGEEAFAYDRPPGMRGIWRGDNWWENTLLTGSFLAREFMVPIAVQNFWEAGENLALGSPGVNFAEAWKLMFPDAAGFFDYIPGPDEVQRQKDAITLLWTLNHDNPKSEWSKFKTMPTYEQIEKSEGLLGEVDTVMAENSKKAGFIEDPLFIADEDLRGASNDELKEFLAYELERQGYDEQDARGGTQGIQIRKIQDELIRRYEDGDKGAESALKDVQPDFKLKRRQQADINLDREMEKALDAYAAEHRTTADDAIIRGGAWTRGTTPQSEGLPKPPTRFYDSSAEAAKSVPTDVLIYYNPDLEDALNASLEVRVREGTARPDQIAQKKFLDEVLYGQVGEDFMQRNRTGTSAQDPGIIKSWYDLNGFEQEILLADKSNPRIKRTHDEWIAKITDSDNPDSLPTVEYNEKRIRILNDASKKEEQAFQQFLQSGGDAAALATLRRQLEEIETSTQILFDDLDRPTSQRRTGTGLQNTGGSYGNVIYWEKVRNEIAAKQNDPKGWYQVMQDERSAVTERYANQMGPSGAMGLDDPLLRELWAEELAGLDWKWADFFNNPTRPWGGELGGKDAWEFITDYRDRFDNPLEMMESDANKYIASTEFFTTNDWVNSLIDYPQILNEYLYAHPIVDKIFDELGINQNEFQSYFDLPEELFAAIASLDRVSGGSVAAELDEAQRQDKVAEAGGLLGNHTMERLKEWTDYMGWGEEAGELLYHIIKQPSTVSKTNPNPLHKARLETRNAMLDADPKLDAYYNFYHPADQAPENIAPHNPANDHLVRQLFALTLSAVNPLEGGGIPNNEQVEDVLRGKPAMARGWVETQNQLFITPEGGPLPVPAPESSSSSGSSSSGGSGGFGFNSGGGSSGGSSRSSSSSGSASGAVKFDAPTEGEVSAAIRTFYDESSAKWRSTGLQDPNMVTAMFFSLGQYINQMPPVFRMGLGARISQALSDPNLEGQDENAIVSLMIDTFSEYFKQVEDITELTSQGMRLLQETPDGLIFEDTDGTLILLRSDGSKEVIEPEPSPTPPPPPAPAPVQQATPPQPVLSPDPDDYAAVR